MVTADSSGPAVNPQARIGQIAQRFVVMVVERRSDTDDRCSRSGCGVASVIVLESAL